MFKNENAFKYAHMKYQHMTWQTKNTSTNIKNKIKFLPKKNQQLNLSLNHSNIQNAIIWQQTCINTEK